MENMLNWTQRWQDLNLNVHISTLIAWSDMVCLCKYTLLKFVSLSIA